MKSEMTDALNRGHKIASDEEIWAREVAALRNLAIKLWNELQIMEATRSIELNGRVDLGREVAKFEQALIQRALQQTGGHQQACARLLGLSPSSLNAKIKRHGIHPRNSHLFDQIGSANPAETHAKER